MADQRTKMGLSDPSIQLPGHDPRIGEVFGRVRIKRLLAEGGMADIYLARHLTLDRDVVVKIPKSNTDPVVVARMMVEARSQFDLKKICGDRILSILDVAQEPEPHIIMEYAAYSITLEQFILDNPNGLFDPSYLHMVLEISKEVSIAVAKAHKQGILHRDIKPANILIVPDRSGVSGIYVIDWGLVKKIGQASKLTNVSATVGSPVFMAPEQGIKDGNVGPKADVFAAALTLFAAVTNELFYWPKDAEKGLDDISEGELLVYVYGWWIDERIQKRIEDCPEWLRPILSPALKVEPDERCTMSEFIELLDNGLEKLKKQKQKSTDLTVQTPRLVEAKRSFGKIALICFLGILAVIVVIVRVTYFSGGSDEPKKKPNKVDNAPMNVVPPAMKAAVSKRALAKPKPLPPLPEKHVMPSNDYIAKLSELRLKLCKEVSMTNRLGCMRTQIRKIYKATHYATGILLFDQTYPYFCFYIAMQYNAPLRAECERAKKDKKGHFKPFSGLQNKEYNDRLAKRVKIRNRIRRERTAWFKKKHNLK